MSNLKDRIEALAPWFQHIEFPNGMTVGDWRTEETAAILTSGIDLKGKTLLDVGCMSGAMSKLFEEQGAEVTGIEPDERSYKQAKLVKEVFGLNMDIRPFTLDNMFEYNSHDFHHWYETYNFVAFAGVYYHLQNPIEAIHQAWALTDTALLIEGQIIPGDKPVAEFILGEYEGDGSNWWFPTMPCLLDWCRTLDNVAQIEDITPPDFRQRNRGFVRVWREK